MKKFLSYLLLFFYLLNYSSLVFAETTTSTNGDEFIETNIETEINENTDSSLENQNYDSTSQELSSTGTTNESSNEESMNTSIDGNNSSEINTETKIDENADLPSENQNYDSESQELSSTGTTNESSNEESMNTSIDGNNSTEIKTETEVSENNENLTESLIPLNSLINKEIEEIKKLKDKEKPNNSQENLSIQTFSSNTTSTNLPYIEGDIIVKYKEGREYGITTKIANTGLPFEKETIAKDIAIITAKDKTTEELINEFQNNPNVEYVQPNFIYYIQDTNLPNDIDFNKLWGLHNTGQNINGYTGTNDIDMDWLEATAIFSGSMNTAGNIVAVIDSGVNYLHEDLVNKMWNGSNCVDENGAYLGNCKNGYDFYYNDNNPMDYNGHGSHIAGIIAAETNNSYGIAGINPNAKIMAIKAGSDNNTLADLLYGYGLSTTDIVRGIYFAKNNGAKVINASFGGYRLKDTDCETGTGITIDMSLYNAIKDFGNAGGLFVAAASNDGVNHEKITTRAFPAGFGTDFTCGDLSVKGLDNIISVAAIDNNGNIANFSDYGNNSVHIGAPGVGIYSTYIDKLEGNYLINSLYYPTSSEAQIPDYYTNVITGTGGWWMDNFLDEKYYDIYPYPDIIYEGGNIAYYKNTTHYLTSKSYNLLENIPSGADVFMNYGAGCYNNLLKPNNDKDFISLSISGDGENYTEIFRDDSEGNSWTGTTIKIPEQFITSNFSFRWNYTTGSNNYIRLCYISQWIQDLYWKKTTPNQYEFLDGTSMATPYVAGLASLARNYKQDSSYLDIKNSILNYGNNLASLNGKTITGKMINAKNTLLSLTDLEGDLSFASGTHINSTGAFISFSANKEGIYSFSGDITNIHTGSYSTGATIKAKLNEGDGVKNIKILLEDNFNKTLELTESITLDTQVPTISLLSVNSGTYIANEDLLLTGSISDVNLESIKINGENIIFGSGGIFKIDISLKSGKNNIEIIANDIAGNSLNEVIEVIRIPKAPSFESKISFGNIIINMNKEITGTGVFLYGTGGLNNTLTGSNSIQDSFSFLAESQKNYYFKGYSITEGYDGELSSTGSIKTPFFVDSTLNKEINIKGKVSVIDGDKSGVIFTKTGGTLNLTGNDLSSITFKTDYLKIIANNNNWDGIISGPEKTTGSGSFSVADYTRIQETTYKVGSDSDLLTFKNNNDNIVAKINLNIGTSYNGKVLKVYESNDNQKNFQYLADCIVSNGVCSFNTFNLATFTLFEKKEISVFSIPSSSSSSSSSGGLKSGGGSGAGGIYRGNGGGILMNGDESSKQIDKTITETTKSQIEVDSKDKVKLRKKLAISRGNLINTKNGDIYQKQIEKVVNNMTNEKLIIVYNNLSKISDNPTIKNNKEFFNYFEDSLVYVILLRIGKDITQPKPNSGIEISKTSDLPNKDISTKQLILSKHKLQKSPSGKKYQEQLKSSVEDITSLDELNIAYSNINKITTSLPSEAKEYYKNLLLYEIALKSKEE